MKIKLEPGSIMPTRAFKTDAGLDLYARETQGMEPGQSAVFDTGVHMEFPHGYYGKIESKSGIALLVPYAARRLSKRRQK